MCTPHRAAGCLAAFLLSGLLFTACSPKLAPVGHYQDSAVVVDGVPNEWHLPLRFSNASYSLQFNVTNDDNDLYVCVSSVDDGTQFRILRSGMTLYFDPKGDKNKDISVHFPIQKHAVRDSRKEALLLQSDYYNTNGFVGMENGQFGVTDTKAPIHLAMKLNNGDSLLVYEVSIPLKNILGSDWPAKAKKNFSVGIVLDAVAGSGGGGGGMRPGGFGMRGMGMGGMRGGGMGGGGGRRYGGQPAQKEDATWYQFRLATK